MGLETVVTTELSDGAAVAAPATLTAKPPAGIASKRSTSPRPRTSWIQLLIALSASLLVIAFVHPLAPPAPALRATFETAITLVALIAAGLTGAQFVHTRRLRKLLLLAALLIIGLVEFVGYGLPAALQTHSVAGFTALVPLGKLSAAALFAASAFTPSDRLIWGDARRRLISTVAVSLGIVLTAEIGGLLLRGHLLVGGRYRGLGIDRGLQQPLVLVVVLATCGFLLYSTAAFARRGREEDNAGLSLMAGAALLLTFEQLYYLRLPWTSNGAITFREALTAVAVGAAMAAVLRNELEIRRTLARAAAMAERRRVAEDLHDGLAQDLALIAAHGARLAQDLGADHPVAVAARRALGISRATISQLSDTAGRPPIEALQAIAHELGNKFGIGIAVDAQRDASLPAEATDEFARIVREAIANAARHGGAHNVAVSLSRTPAGVALRVCDDGCGINDDATPAPEGFGVSSMRDRAEALGGHLVLRQRKAGGTELEVVLP